jgi:hypothetical protein
MLKLLPVARRAGSRQHHRHLQHRLSMTKLAPNVGLLQQNHRVA